MPGAGCRVRSEKVVLGARVQVTPGARARPEAPGAALSLTYEQMLIYSYEMPATVPPAADPETTPGCAEPHGHDSQALEAVRRRLLAGASVSQIAETFKLLGDPTRVRLVDILSHGERCVCDLASLAGLSESAVSHQLRLLRAARLVRVRRAGRMAYYTLDDHHVVGLLHDTRKHIEEDPS